MVLDPIDLAYDAEDPGADLEFLSDLGDRPIVTNDEGLHALIMFASADGVDTSADYGSRVALAKELNWLEESWDEPSNMAMQRGTMASAIASICKIKGGVMMQLVGRSRRYASRELTYIGILTPGSEQQTMSGQEFISILGKAQDYMVLDEAAKAKKKEGAGDESPS